ncbi:hypothetical protein EV360DRAFT_71032 [Lentinula raphanica]|nr:hypothetical protein EV360DRAFT_71032 [Lentinula raphanica]
MELLSVSAYRSVITEAGEFEVVTMMPLSSEPIHRGANVIQTSIRANKWRGQFLNNVPRSGDRTNISSALRLVSFTKNSCIPMFLLTWSPHLYDLFIMRKQQGEIRDYFNNSASPSTFYSAKAKRARFAEAIQDPSTDFSINGLQRQSVHYLLESCNCADAIEDALWSDLDKGAATLLCLLLAFAIGQAENPDRDQYSNVTLDDIAAQAKVSAAVDQARKVREFEISKINQRERVPSLPLLATLLIMSEAEQY